MLHVVSNVHGQFVDWLHHTRFIRFGDLEELLANTVTTETMLSVIRYPSRAGGLAIGFGRFGSWSAFFHPVGLLGEQGRWAGTRFWRVWWVWRLGGCGAVIRRERSGEDPTHTQNWESRSHRPRAKCLGVGGVPHQLDGGGRVRVLGL